MDTARYIVLKQPLNMRTAAQGSVDICPPDMVTAYHLWDRLRYDKVLSGEPGWYVIHGNRTGKIEDWGHKLIPGEVYTICPDVQGLEIPLGVLIAGLVLGAATVGYSIYNYIDMKNMLLDMTNQDPTRDDGSASQSYAYASKENYRTDNLPTPIVYGKTKVGGVVINELQYSPYEGESESYKAQYALAEGPVRGIAGSSDILINDSMLTEYTDYSWEQSTGGSSPSASTLFTELYQQRFPSNEFSGNPVLYFSFTNNNSTLTSVACLNESDHRLVTDSSKTSPTITAYANASISTIVRQTSISSATLRINTTQGYVQYSTDLLEWFQPYGDPWNIEWRMRFSSADFAACGTTGAAYYVFEHIPGAAPFQQYRCHLEKQTATSFQMVLYCGQIGSTNISLNSIDLQSTAYENDWHHYRICRDGEFIRWYIDGEDVTGLSGSSLSTATTSLTMDLVVGSNNAQFNFGGRANDALPCNLADFRFDSGGNVAYEPFTPGTAAHDPSGSEYYINTPARGNADKVLWQYRFPRGCFDLGVDGSEFKRQGSLFEEDVRLALYDIRRYNTGVGGAGYSTGLTDYAVDVWGRNNGMLVRQHEVPFDFIKVAQSSTQWVLGEIITGSTTKHYGELAGYRYDGTDEYLYLRNPTGEFTTNDTAEGENGASGKVQNGGTLQTATTYSALTLKKVSPSWDHSRRRNVSELKSITEVRGFREITPITGVQLTYPHTAWAAINIRAQKGLTNIPKFNAIFTGFSTKELYRWDTTSLALTTVGVKNLRNPAWAVWDVLTDGFWDGSTAYARGTTGTYDGYGIGLHPKYLDYDSFAEWSSYCTDEVDGNPRCLVNISIDEKDKNLWDAVESIALVGRGRLVPMGNKYYAKVDQKVDAPNMVVGGSIIEAGSYEEEYIDDEGKYDELTIKFLNEDNKYIEDEAGDARNEWNDPSENEIYESKTRFVKGITNSDQAKREAIRRRQITQSLYKRIRFVMDVDAVNFEVGDVIQVQHDSNKYSFSRVCKEVVSPRPGAYIIRFDGALTIPWQEYGDDGVVAWRNQADDTWLEASIVNDAGLQSTEIGTNSANALSLVAGAPLFIGRCATAAQSDFDLIRVEEINILEDQKVEIIGYNYDESVYTHTDYGTTAI